MKRILILIAVAAMFVMSGCEKETEGVVTGTVYYPYFVNSGSQINVIGLGENFTLPEVKVYDGPKDITSETTISGVDDVDITTPGYYEVSYSARTEDGYSDTYTMLIFVYDTDYKEALLTGDADDKKYAGGLEGLGGGLVTVSKFQKGVYYCDDFFAGYYFTFRGYGAPYTAPGYLIYVGSNTFIIRGTTSPWGPIVDSNGVVLNPASGILTYEAEFVADGYNWGGRDFTLIPIS